MLIRTRTAISSVDGDRDHLPGDVLDASETIARAWVTEGLADYVDPADAPPVDLSPGEAIDPLYSAAHNAPVEAHADAGQGDIEPAVPPVTSEPAVSEADSGVVQVATS